MQVNANVQDKILSLLLELANCVFVRVTEFKRNGNVRYQFGDEQCALLIDSAEHKQNNAFVEEELILFEDYQFNISILSPNHAHIECFMAPNKDPKQDYRKQKSSLVANSARVLIELVNPKALPKFITALNSNSIEKTTQSFTSPNIDTEIIQTSTLLLKSMCIAIESLHLIDHYNELTSDSLTKLRSRSALQRGIDEQIMHSNMVLCMVHCIDFQHVNRKFGQAKGDVVLHEIAGILEQYTRTDDISGRFGGALFGIAINADSVEDGMVLANKLQTALHAQAYLQNAVRLTFNVGIAFVSQEEDQLDNSSTSSLLINRAEQALKAAQNASKPTIVQWEPDKFRLDDQDFNYLGGIFTPDNVTNYRNMLLLWDISSIIADEHTFERLLKSVVERLAFTFEFAYAGIVLVDDEKGKSRLEQNFSFELQNATEIIDLPWESHPYQDLVNSAAKLALENSQHTESQEDELNSLVIPLGNDSNECFFIMGHSELLELTHDTVMLFVGFARQLGKAYKRSQLEDQLNKNLEQQNAQLAQELTELKAGMKSSALVYRSPKMQKIVEQTQRAAQTDTTVLITGESGTGKEKLINAIHLLSARTKKPLIIVDCGSIPENLLESELFGHTKGAFTGAQNSSVGKIQAADGGILVLDEIGELPLSMQPKLLRFVQEKQYTPVGGNKSISVDVKIVAVTNRDLSFEVSKGQFRKDLFYRLNVVTLHNPPLRERTEDIDLLCQHFLSKFSRQFEMDKKRLSQTTIEQMKQYEWPGNIRELENKLMQASLLTINDEIQFSDLNLDIAKRAPEHTPTLTPNDETRFDYYEEPPSILGESEIPTRKIVNMMPAPNAASAVLQTDNSPQVSSIQSPNAWCNQFLDATRNLLLSMDMHTKLNVSIGNAVELTLLHMAYNECGSHARTAVLLQLPISTARRRLQKSLPDLRSFAQNNHWQTIESLLAQIVSTQVQLISPVDTIKNMIAQNILEIHASNMGLASQLMGVSEPTMYKLRKQLLSNTAAG
jgi:diguanylate cyclase (GGDEF)-like protein